MVLSNKKLKRRLRAELAESLTKTVIESDPRKPDLNAQPQLSLKELIDSAASKPRLTKREKRRKIISLQGPEAVKSRRSSVGGESEENKGDKKEKEGGSESLVEKKKKKKKRKREDEEEVVKEGDLGSEENGVVKEAKKPNKKKKKKGKKKKNKKGKSEEEENNGAELGSEEKVVMETNNNDESQSYEEVAKKVYAGGIPYYSTEDDIRSYFDGCGTITEIDCMKFPETGKFRGIAIITFKTDAAAKRALALDGSDMGGLYLKIQPYNYKATRVNKVPDFAPKIVEGYNRIYVGNLSWDITEDELRKFFSDCNISSIRFGEDKETGEFRGYAHVDFSDSLSLTMALKLDQQIVCRRPAKISCAVPMKGGGETQSRSAPTSQVADNAGPNPGSGKADNAGPNPGSGKADNAEPSLGSGKADNTEPIPGSGKIRRRTCYECGEKGHLSSACPNKQNADPTNGARLTMALKLDQQIVCGRPAKISCAVPMEGGAGTQSRSAPTSQVADNAGPNPGSGKADNAEPSLGSGKADNTEPIPGSGKIRRRTCYECGEKGHLSSACPNKQNADPTNGAS